MDIFVLYCYTHDTLGMHDIATLRCVSKNINKTTQIFLENPKKTEKAWTNTLKSINILDLDLSKKGEVLFVDIYYLIRYLYQMNRWYRYLGADNNARNKFLDNIKKFVINIIPNMFYGLKEPTMLQQQQTIDFLLKFATNSSFQLLSIYAFYYFLSKLTQKNSVQFLRNPKLSIIASASVRNHVIDQTHNLCIDIRNAITHYPYDFVTKTLDLLDKTRRLCIF